MLRFKIERSAVDRVVMKSTVGNRATMRPVIEPRLQEGLDYWRDKAKTAGRPLPARADIDPTEIPRLLPDIMLVDVLPGGRYRYRLIGSANAEAHGVNATGRFLDEVLPGPEYRAHVLGLYDQSVAERRPLYSESLFIGVGQTVAERHTKVLFLPLAADGVTIDIVMVMQVFFYTDPSTRNRHFIEARPYREIVRTLL